MSAFQGKKKETDKIFAELESKRQTSDFLLLAWKIIISERNEDWEELIKLAKELSALAEKSNFRDELPRHHLLLAKANFHLKRTESAKEHLEKTITLIGEMITSQESNLSLGIIETYHDAYRLSAQTYDDDPKKSFELAEYLKARVLRDRINGSSLRNTANFSNEIRQKLEELSSKYIEDQNVSDEIERIEKTLTYKIPELKLEKTDLSELDKIPDLENSAIISYFFTPDKKLSVYIWEKGKPVKLVRLPISENEIENLALETQPLKQFKKHHWS